MWFFKKHINFKCDLSQTRLLIKRTMIVNSFRWTCHIDKHKMHIKIQNLTRGDSPPRPKTSAAKFLSYANENGKTSSFESRYSLPTLRSALRASKGESFRIQLENEYKSRATRPITADTLLKENITENLVDKFLTKLSQQRPNERPKSARDNIYSREGAHSSKINRAKPPDSVTPSRGRSQSQMSKQSMTPGLVMQIYIY